MDGGITTSEIPGQRPGGEGASKGKDTKAKTSGQSSHGKRPAILEGLLQRLQTPEAPTFTSPQQLRQEREYTDLGRPMKREKQGREGQSLETQNAAEHIQLISTAGQVLQSPDQPGQTFAPVETATQEKTGLAKTTETIGKGILKGGKWLAETAEKGVGLAIRGNIVRKLKRMERNPEAYAGELQQELTRAFVEALTPEDPAAADRRNNRTLRQGGITALANTPLATVIPMPLSPTFIYSSGSAFVTAINNIPNTYRAFREGKIRKGIAYATMTAAGIATGVLPVLHNLTNTFYYEFMQKPYDHAWTKGKLEIIDRLMHHIAEEPANEKPVVVPVTTPEPGPVLTLQPQEGPGQPQYLSETDPQKRRIQFGQHIVMEAMHEAAVQTGKQVNYDLLASRLQQCQTDFNGLMSGRTAMQGNYNALQFKGSLWQRIKAFRTAAQMQSTYYSHGDQAVDLLHKGHTIHQLQDIMQTMGISHRGLQDSDKPSLTQQPVGKLAYV